MKALLLVVCFLAALTAAQQDLQRFAEIRTSAHSRSRAPSSPPVPPSSVIPAAELNKIPSNPGSGAALVLDKNGNSVQSSGVAGAASIGSHLVEDDDDDGDKTRELREALQNTKDTIVSTAADIKQQKKWVKETVKIIESYVHKVRRVNSNIRDQQKVVKESFRKKKQIQNLLLQRQLNAKLKGANEDLKTLKAALEQVERKQINFAKSKTDVAQTIGELEDELKKLRGDQSARKF